MKDESADAVKGHGLGRKLMSAFVCLCYGQAPRHSGDTTDVGGQGNQMSRQLCLVHVWSNRQAPNRNSVEQIETGQDFPEIHNKTRHGQDMERFVPTSELKQELFPVSTLFKNREYVRMCIFTYIQYY